MTNEKLQEIISEHGGLTGLYQRAVAMDEFSKRAAEAESPPTARTFKIAFVNMRLFIELCVKEGLVDEAIEARRMQAFLRQLIQEKGG